jgi:hypothetical protein
MTHRVVLSLWRSRRGAFLQFSESSIDAARSDVFSLTEVDDLRRYHDIRQPCVLLSAEFRGIYADQISQAYLR